MSIQMYKSVAQTHHSQAQIKESLLKHFPRKKAIEMAGYYPLKSASQDQQVGLVFA